MTERIIDTLGQVFSIVHAHWQALVNFLSPSNAQHFKLPWRRARKSKTAKKT